MQCINEFMQKLQVLGLRIVEWRRNTSGQVRLGQGTHRVIGRFEVKEEGRTPRGHRQIQPVGRIRIMEVGNKGDGSNLGKE